MNFELFNSLTSSIMAFGAASTALRWECEVFSARAKAPWQNKGQEQSCKTFHSLFCSVILFILSIDLT